MSIKNERAHWTFKSVIASILDRPVFDPYRYGGPVLGVSFKLKESLIHASLSKGMMVYQQGYLDTLKIATEIVDFIEENPSYTEKKKRSLVETVGALLAVAYPRNQKTTNPRRNMGIDINTSFYVELLTLRDTVNTMQGLSIHEVIYKIRERVDNYVKARYGSWLGYSEALNKASPQMPNRSMGESECRLMIALPTPKKASIETAMHWEFCSMEEMLTKSHYAFRKFDRFVQWKAKQFGYGLIENESFDMYGLEQAMIKNGILRMHPTHFYFKYMQIMQVDRKRVDRFLRQNINRFKSKKPNNIVKCL